MTVIKYKAINKANPSRTDILIGPKNMQQTLPCFPLNNNWYLSNTEKTKISMPTCSLLLW